MFQNLQNLANIQQNMAPMSQQMSQLAANLQGLTSMPSNPVINSPLNLSVSAPGKFLSFLKFFAKKKVSCLSSKKSVI